MAGIHEILGGLVVVAFIVMAILAAIAATGRDIPWIRQASFIAAGLLLLQYLVGVLLLANGFRNTRWHVVDRLAGADSRRVAAFVSAADFCRRLAAWLC